MAQSSRPARWLIPLAAIALTYLVFAVFFPTLGFEFVDLDVPTQVVDNPNIQGLTFENLKRIFFSRGTTTSYYPFRTLTYAIDYQLWGLHPRGFKLTNVLIHLGSVLLLFWLMLRLFRHPGAGNRPPEAWWGVAVATFSAGVFAVHPVVVEPVVWVAGREELLMTLGALACLHFHFTGRRLEETGVSPRKAIACYVGAAFCCAAACLSNAVAAVIPLLITAWDVLTLAKPKVRKIVYGTSALWVIGVATIVVKQAGARADLIVQPMGVDQANLLSAVIQKLGYGDEFIPGEVGTFSVERLMLALNVFWLNLGSIFWPAKLGVCYQPVTARSFLETDVLLGGVCVVLTCLGLWMLRRQKGLLFGLLWFCLALGPTSQIMPHHIHRADRFLYLPLVGLAVSGAMGLRPLRNALKSPAAVGAVIGVGILGLLGLVALSAPQVQRWRNSIAVWENCVRVGPENILGHWTLGNRLAQAGEIDRAFSHYKIAAGIKADSVKALTEFARYLATCDDKDLREYDLAIRLARWACDLAQWNDPQARRTLALAYNNSAVELGEGRQFGRAIDFYNQAMAIDPEYAGPAFNLALLLATCSDPGFRRPDEAVALAERACRMVDRPDSNQLMILAVAYAQAEQPDMAVHATEKAIGLAEAEGNAELAALLRSRLRLYRDQPSAGSSRD